MLDRVVAGAGKPQVPAGSPAQRGGVGADWVLLGGDGSRHTTAVWRTIRDFGGKGYSATFTDVRIICPCWSFGVLGVVLAKLVHSAPPHTFSEGCDEHLGPNRCEPKSRPHPHPVWGTLILVGSDDLLSTPVPWSGLDGHSGLLLDSVLCGHLKAQGR